MFEKLFPGSIAVIGELYVDHGRSAWLDGFGDQRHLGLGRGSAAFLDVTLLTAADQVLPTGASILAARHDVIEAEFAGGEFFAAILASAAVPGEDIATVQPDRFSGEPIVEREPDDARHRQAEPHGAHPIVTMGLELPFELADLPPAIEIIRKVLPVFDVNDFCQVAVEQRECPLRAGNANGHVVPVQDQYVTTEAGNRR